MTSLVKQFQADILSGGREVTDLLRTAKLISAKLDLSDLEEWIDKELRGYSDSDKVPSYRLASAGILQSFNPYRGWITVGGASSGTRAFQEPLSSIEQYAKKESACFQPAVNVPLQSQIGDMDDVITGFMQRFVISGTVFKAILEAVKDQLLDWSIELEKRGITGENMSFAENEKQAAQKTVFHIQNMNGIIGDLKDSQVAIYDYSTIHQNLKEAGISQEMRNEIESIMDEIQGAPSKMKKGLVEKGKQWVIANEKFLGAGAAIIRKALGLDIS